jgi:signal peptidase I
MSEQTINQIETPNNRRDTLKPPTLRRPGFFNELIRTIVFVFVVTVLFDMVIPRSLVEGISMHPTFETGDRLVVSRLGYMLGAPQRGDIVVFNSINPNEPTTMLIKRLVGLPGDTIEWRDNQLFINGSLVNEPYIPETCRCRDEIVTLAPNEYFVMGDNRQHSNDSRAFGAIMIGDIVGQAIFRYWPPEKFGVISHFDYEFDN